MIVHNAYFTTFPTVYNIPCLTMYNESKVHVHLEVNMHPKVEPNQPLDTPQKELKPDEMNNPEPLPGTPGFRTRLGRSGYDPLDTSTETGRMEGKFFQRLFTLRLITHNPFYLALMFVFGVVPFGFLAALSIGSVRGMEFPNFASGVFFFVLMVVLLCITGALSANLVLSLLHLAQKR
jgi:hypothetical protein